LKLTPQPTKNALWLISAYSAVLVLVIAVQYSYDTLTLSECAAGFVLLLATSLLLWFQRNQSATLPAWTIAAGVLGGWLWGIEISINNLIAPPLPGRDIIDNIFWALIALIIFLQAALSAFQARSMRAGLQAGTWSGLVSGLFACATALSYIVLGMGFLTRDPLNIAEWAARGSDVSAPSMAAYFAFETMAGGLMHLVILGVIMGALLGWLGGALGMVASGLIRQKEAGSREEPVPPLIEGQTDQKIDPYISGLKDSQIK
jgi:hypothetical protein